MAAGINEADTCRRYITPALVEAGWGIHDQIVEQRTFTDGRVIIAGRKTQRRKGKRADYILRYTRDLPLAVVEAKAFDLSATDGLQQAIDYAQILGLPFAYATNGQEIVERDLLTGLERSVVKFPGPDELWERWKFDQQLTEPVEKVIKTPYYSDPQRVPRYYQTIAINRAIEALAKGHERVLLTLATGTGKSFIAFQICYRLWQARWNRKGSHFRPKILYLADRNVLLDQPMLGVFAPFGDALHRISGEAVKSREMYFATYQSIARDTCRPGLYLQYAQDFFDLVVVDECHRGSARDDSNWREILDWFTGAAKIGMTATPLRQDNRDTYDYFGNPLIEYSLAQGINDGFLAPFKVKRVVTNVDATGWRPESGQRDRYGEPIPDAEYLTKDFEKTIVLPERTQAIARYISDFMSKTDRFAKTIVFCLDQEHAQNMRVALIKANQDLVQDHADYVCRVTADEGQVGRGHLDRFQDIDRLTPVVLTTSEMLTTGVDAPTAKNIVLCRVVNSISTFKQIVGRGTRLRTDYDKWFFQILDFTGTATRNFADPEFDGFPLEEDEEELKSTSGIEDERDTSHEHTDEEPFGSESHVQLDVQSDNTRTKFYIDGIQVLIVADLVYELDTDGRQLRTVKYTEYAGEKVRSLWRTVAELRGQWVVPEFRAEVLKMLELHGIDVQDLAGKTKLPDADPFDLLCHVAFNGPLRTRAERAEVLKRKHHDFWEQYAPQARAVLTAMVDAYARQGVEGLDFPMILQVRPFTEMGNVIELCDRFGGAERMRGAVGELQRRLYSDEEEPLVA